MGNFNSFYFFHIPKTIDPVVDVSVIRPLYEKMESKGIDVSLNRRYSDHSFWRETPAQTYVLCFVRDPMRRAVSEFCYSVDFGELNVERAKSRSINQPNEKHTLDSFESWMHTFHTPNYQVASINDGQHDEWFVAAKRLMSVQLACKVESLNTGINYHEWSNNPLLSLANRVIGDLGLGEEVCHVPLFANCGYYEFFSSHLFNMLTGSSLFAELQEMNDGDMNLYNQNFYIALD